MVVIEKRTCIKHFEIRDLPKSGSYRSSFPVSQKTCEKYIKVSSFYVGNSGEFSLFENNKFLNTANSMSPTRQTNLEMNIAQVHEEWLRHMEQREPLLFPELRYINGLKHIASRLPHLLGL